MGKHLLLTSFSESIYGLDSVPNEAQRQHSDITQEIYETPTIAENRRRRGEKVNSEYLPQPEKRRNREELKRS